LFWQAIVAVASALHFHAARSGRCLQTVAADAGALRVLERLGDAVIRVRVDAPRRLQ